MTKYKTVTKVVRENRRRSVEYWEGYKDALQVVGDCGASEVTSKLWTYLRELIQDAKGRLEGCLKVREASKAAYEHPETSDCGFLY
jgi:hypothetical protein